MKLPSIMSNKFEVFLAAYCKATDLDADSAITFLLENLAAVGFGGAITPTSVFGEAWTAVVGFQAGFQVPQAAVQVEATVSKPGLSLRAQEALLLAETRLKNKLEIQRQAAELKLKLAEKKRGQLSAAEKKRRHNEAQTKYRAKKRQEAKDAEAEAAKLARLTYIDRSVLAVGKSLSGYVGVLAHGRKWRAKAIDAEGREVVLAVHETPEEAAWERYCFLKERNLPTGTPDAILRRIQLEKYAPGISADLVRSIDEENEELIAMTKLGWQPGQSREDWLKMVSEMNAVAKEDNLARKRARGDLLVGVEVFDDEDAKAVAADTEKPAFNLDQFLEDALDGKFDD